MLIETQREISSGSRYNKGFVPDNFSLPRPWLLCWCQISCGYLLPPGPSSTQPAAVTMVMCACCQPSPCRHLQDRCGGGSGGCNLSRVMGSATPHVNTGRTSQVSMQVHVQECFRSILLPQRDLHWRLVIQPRTNLGGHLRLEVSLLKAQTDYSCSWKGTGIFHLLGKINGRSSVLWYCDSLLFQLRRYPDCQICKWLETVWIFQRQSPTNKLFLLL